MQQSYVEALESRRLLTSVFTVTTTAAAGDGSLRQAIIDANGVAANVQASIVFDIAGKGVHTIKPVAEFPAITAQVDIQGTTDSSGNPLIEIDGENAGTGAPGIEFVRNTAGNTQPSRVSGLIVNRFDGNGVIIIGSGLTQLFGCRIGTDATGKHSRPNGGDGILINSPSNQIGAPSAGPAFQNVISGNAHNGINIAMLGTNNIIENCLIGTDAAGKYALGNAQQGIVIGAASNAIGGSRANQGNVVSGNGVAGIVVNAANIDILGNKVGTDATGTAAIPNISDGIDTTSVDNATIGDGTAGGRNIVSGNGGSGILVGNSTHSHVANNFVGTDITGTKNLGNAGKGVWFLSGNTESVTDCVIDGSGAQGVLINGDAVSIDILRCKIGIDVNKHNAIPNAGNGIETNEGTFCNFEGNTIAHNGLNGIQIQGQSSNVISANGIFSNGHLGIKLGDDNNTPLPNHSGAAAGPNSDQNYPVITSATNTGGDNHIVGTLDSIANKQFKIQFFINDATDPSGFGEGQTFYTELTLTSDANGHLSFNTHVSVDFKFGQSLTATATLLSGTDQVETSEFSKAVGVQGSSITGTVFNDANGNGKRDAGEKGLSNRTVFVDNGRGTFDPDGQFGKTDADGNYRVFGLTPGTVRLRLAGNAGFRQTFPSPAAAFRDVNTVEFGLVKGILFGQQKSTQAAAVLAIEAGSGLAYDDLSGQKFGRDTQHPETGPIIPFGVIGTDDDPLFYSFASGSKFSYFYNVPNGNYTLKLLFADGTGTAAGQRKFNVSVNGTQVLKNFDIFAAAGIAKKALTKSLSVKITNGKFILTLQGVTGLAMISAFELIPN